MPLRCDDSLILLIPVDIGPTVLQRVTVQRCETQHCTSTTNQSKIRRSRHKPQPSFCTVTDNCNEVRDYGRGVNIHIQYPQGLTDEECSITAEVTAIKRQLKTAHRSLEKFYMEKCYGLGEEAEKLVDEATRHAWRSYRNMVKLEESLKVVSDGEGASWTEPMIAQSREGRSGIRNIGEQEAHMPKRTQRSPSPLNMYQQHIMNERDEARFDMSGALAIEDWTVEDGSEPLRNAVNALRTLPRVLTYGASSQAMTSLDHPKTNLEKIPQPRNEVTRRIQLEEANMEPTLRDPDSVRRGSCNGFMITVMTMKGVEDKDFVLPHLHYMKLHEVRYLKQWLVDEGHITSSGPMSRMEKILSCLQLLQTGCRYEALAVIYSRSPRQVKESCIEAMHGLLTWHRRTVRDGETGEQAMYLPLWGIWAKFVGTDGQAGLYFGFEWTHVAKVLVALNVYMGRWRMQGRFAVDGPAFVWGKFFMSQGIDNVPSLVDGDRRCNVKI